MSFRENFHTLRFVLFLQMNVIEMSHEIKLVKAKDKVKESSSFVQAVGPILAYGQVNKD